MKVALVSPYALDVVGGVQAHVLALAAALRAAGDEVVVLGPSATADGGVAVDGNDAGAASFLRVGRTVSVPTNGSRAPIGLAPATAARLVAALRRSRPDIVHVHEPFVPVVGLAALGPAARRAGAVRGSTVPRVLTLHATAEGGALPRLYRAFRRPARRLIAARDVLTAVSPVAASFHGRMLGLPPAAFTLVPNGVDVARFVTHGAATRATPRIVFLGRLEHRKGADVVVRAFLALASERPDVELRILGDGPLRPLLERLRGGAPRAVAERIELAGRADPTALPRLLGDADVAVLPARGGESFGIVLLEAMAAGVPIVATDIPGYRDVARHDREALLVVPDDAAATAVAIGRILDEPALAARLRAAGRRRAEEHDWAAIAARMQALYGQAVAAPAEGEGPDGPDERAR